MSNKIIRFCSIALALCVLLGCRKHYTYQRVDIPDASEVAGTGICELYIPIAARDAIIQDLDVEIAIDHPNLANLEASIESPSGTVVPLFWDLRGEGLDSLIFNDEAYKPIEPYDFPPGYGPWGGEGQIQDYNPHLLGLFLFDGEDANGTWKLVVSHREEGDVGAITLFALAINGEW